MTPGLVTRSRADGGAGRTLINWTTNPVAAAEFADLFPNAELVVQPGAGHFPWLTTRRLS
jgi:pimeloyl-ACP methyl ester carboxylesterase